MILSREQFHIDSLGPEYNINPIAGPRLGSTHSADTKAKISEAMTGKTHTVEAKVLISEAKKGENNPMFGKTGILNSLFGKLVF